METMTVSKSAVQAAARKRWGGGSATYLRENKRAPTKAEREDRSQRCATLLERSRQIEAELKECHSEGDCIKALIKAARFVVDVDGEEPSMGQLRKAVEAAERRQSLLEEQAENRTTRKKLAVYSRRWSVGTSRSVGGFGFYTVHAEADTLVELMEKIQQRT